MLDIAPVCPAGQASTPIGTSHMSRKNPASMRVAGQFLPLGQRDTIFLSGGRDAHSNLYEIHPNPRAPLGAGNESRLGMGKTPCPTCPFFMRVSIHGGCAQILPGQPPLSSLVQFVPLCCLATAQGHQKKAAGPWKPLPTRVHSSSQFVQSEFQNIG